ncbi:MAG: SlyX family protein, partial [Alloalcanivorax venustensis]
ILPARARPTSGEPMSDDRFLDIETKLAYQEDLVASLNQIVSAQQRKLDELEAAYRKLVDRVVEQSEELAALRIEDAPPPHY